MPPHPPFRSPTSRTYPRRAGSQLARPDAGVDGLRWAPPVEGAAATREGLVPIGSVLRPHGLAGEVVVYPYLNDLAYYGRVREVGTVQGDGSIRWHRVQHASIAGDRILLQLEGRRSRDALPSLIGLDLHVPRADLPLLDAREFYWYDLEGLSVYTQEGDFLGRVVDFFPTGSNEVLVVQDGPRETLIPFIGEVILGVDETQRCLRIKVLPGLL